MSSFTKDEFDCHILDEGFTAKDILDQKKSMKSLPLTIRMRSMLRTSETF